MKVRDLITEWNKNAQGRLTDQRYSVCLPLEDAAKIEALHEMYPKKTCEALVTELLGTALDELEASMPYVCGTRIVTRDEEDNPIYEDVGPTPEFLALAQKHLKRLKSESSD